MASCSCFGPDSASGCPSSKVRLRSTCRSIKNRSKLSSGGEGRSCCWACCCRCCPSPLSRATKAPQISIPIQNHLRAPCPFGRLAPYPRGAGCAGRRASSDVRWEEAQAQEVEVRRRTETQERSWERRDENASQPTRCAYDCGSEACSRCGAEWAGLGLDLILTLGLRLVRYGWRGGPLGALTSRRVWKAEVRIHERFRRTGNKRGGSGCTSGTSRWC